MVKVAFIHPDLGIGGAERLVVDAAMALKSKEHSVEMFTAHHDPKHCFEETKDGRLNVHVAGDWLPRHILNKGHALFAYLRMIYVAIYLVFFSKMKFDIIFCDQISACIPILRFSGAKTIYYCHFPDQLLTERKTRIKRLYRWPIDKLEEKTTGMADMVLVNSKFTSRVFHDTFKTLTHITPTILYPSLNFSSFDQDISESEYVDSLLPECVTTIFLSINRYERKKNLPLAVRAFSKLLDEVEEDQKPKIHLIIAGGYDERVVENRKHYQELKELAESLDIINQISFVRSFSDFEKIQLLAKCIALIYTPSNEHFGICPLEAMYMRRPVIAANSGGPLETVVSGRTGFLCEANEKEFARKMLYFVRNPTASISLGELANEHVEKNFSFDAFATKIDDIIQKLF